MTVQSERAGKRVAGRLVGVLRASHPGPTLAVATVVGLLGVAVGLEAWRVALLTAAMLANQLSVGLSNDWIDAARDTAADRAEKPVASGAVPVSWVRLAALVLAPLSIALTVPLGWAAASVHLLGLASGWAYNLGLKRTVLSPLTYLLGFGSLPLLATLALPEPRPATAWAITLAALLGLAAHFANVLPDIEDDRRAGMLGLPQRIGARPTAIVAFAVLAAAAVCALLGPSDPIGTVRLVGVGLTVAIAVVGVVLSLRTPASRLAFRLIIAAALVNVVQLVLAGDSLLA